MRDFPERCYFRVCLFMGGLLRAARYSKTAIDEHRGMPIVRKRRAFYAPLLIRASVPVVKALDAGVRVLRQREWEERERQLHARLGRGAIATTDDGGLLLPRLPGVTLGALLEDARVDSASRLLAIQRAASSLAEFHRHGFTHADAMADNVLVTPGSHAAYWFDFETVHEPTRTPAWRRADDLRALLTTTLVQVRHEMRAETLNVLLDAYGDDETSRVMAASVTPVWRRSLTFHLAQAPLTFASFKEIGRLLEQRHLRHPAVAKAVVNS